MAILTFTLNCVFLIHDPSTSSLLRHFPTRDPINGFDVQEEEDMI